MQFFAVEIPITGGALVKFGSLTPSAVVAKVEGIGSAGELAAISSEVSLRFSILCQ